MMESQKTIGMALIGMSVILLVLLMFVKASFDEQGVFMCQEISLNPNLSMDDCPAHKNETSWMIMAVFGISFLVFGTGIYLVAMPYQGEEKKSKLHTIDMSTLDEQEQKIVAMLQERDGSIYQSDLMKELDVTKVQMTRILDKMEGKKLIDRKRRGMTNVVLLR